MNRDEFYHVPFSSGEALAVLAVLRAIDGLSSEVDTELEPGIVRSAIARFDDETPDFLRDKAVRLASEIAAAFRKALELSSDEETSGDEPPFPIGRTRRLLEDAFAHRTPVEIEYFVRSRNEWTARVVDISDIRDDGSGTWMMTGRCSLRHDTRQFRLDHIRSVRLQNDDESGEADGFGDPFEDE